MGAKVLRVGCIIFFFTLLVFIMLSQISKGLQ